MAAKRAVTVYNSGARTYQNGHPVRNSGVHLLQSELTVDHNGQGKNVAQGRNGAKSPAALNTEAKQQMRLLNDLALYSADKNMARYARIYAAVVSKEAKQAESVPAHNCSVVEEKRDDERHGDSSGRDSVGDHVNEQDEYIVHGALWLYQLA